MEEKEHRYKLVGNTWETEFTMPLDEAVEYKMKILKGWQGNHRDADAVRIIDAV